MLNFWRATFVICGVVSQTVQALPVVPRDIADPDQPSYISPAIMTPQDDVRFQTVSDEVPSSAINPEPDIPGINVKINGLEVTGGPRDVNLTQAYDSIAIVDKGLNTLTIHQFFTKNGRRRWLKPRVHKISSGQEQWICHPQVDKNGNVTKLEARWTGTPTGFFNPFYTHADHHSKAFNDANMYNAVFFDKVGIAVHEGDVTRPRASHGCVRTTASGSADWFRSVLQSGAQPDPNSREFEAKCPDSKNTELTSEGQQCVANMAEREAGYRNLVRQAITERNEIMGGFPGRKLSVPALNQDGSVRRDDAKQPQEKAAKYKALVIVQCTNRAGADCSTQANHPNFANKKDCSSPKLLMAARQRQRERLARLNGQTPPVNTGGETPAQVAANRTAERPATADRVAATRPVRPSAPATSTTDDIGRVSPPAPSRVAAAPVRERVTSGLSTYRNDQPVRVARATRVASQPVRRTYSASSTSNGDGHSLMNPTSYRQAEAPAVERPRRQVRTASVARPARPQATRPQQQVAAVQPSRDPITAFFSNLFGGGS